MLYLRVVIGRTALLCAAIASLVMCQTNANAQSFTRKDGITIEQHLGPLREWIIKRSATQALQGHPVLEGRNKVRRTSGLDSFERIGGPTSYDFQSVGPRKVAVILANVIAENKDDSTRFIPAPSYSAEQVREFMFGSSESVDSTLRASSWGKSYLDGDLTGDTQPDIIGPITLRYLSNQETDGKGSAPDYAGGDRKTVGDVCYDLPILSDLIDGGFIDESTPTDAMPLILVDKGVTSYFNCPWMAVTDQGSRGGAQSIVSTLEPITAGTDPRDRNRMAIVHELGHAMGLDHSHGDSITYEGPDQTLGNALKDYGDLACTMGLGPAFSLGQFNVPQAYRLGWLPRGSAIEITRAGTYTVTLGNPAHGPYSTNPTSLWIERRVASDSTAAPGFIVVSAGTGGAMNKKIQLTQAETDGPLTLTAREHVPFGLTIHSVSLAAIPNTGGYLKRPQDGASYLEGMIPLNEQLVVKNLGVTVKLLARDGDNSIVEVQVKDLHQVVTEEIERVAPGTLDSFKTVRSLKTKANGTFSRKERVALSNLAKLTVARRKVFEFTRALSPESYVAARDVHEDVIEVERLSRRILRDFTIGRLAPRRLALMKKIAVSYLRNANGANR